MTAAHERRARINEIRRLLAAAGLAPKDMFLTQPPAPPSMIQHGVDDMEYVAYQDWQRRERRRRSIARRLLMYGLTAHDLAPALDRIAETAP